jgi:HK97 family phage portal protein
MHKLRRPKPSLLGRVAAGSLELLRSGVRAAGSAVGMRFNGYGGQGMGWRLLLPGSQYDYEAAAGDLWRNSAVAACLRWIKVNFPEPRVEVITETADGKEEIVQKSEVARLLHRPNPHWDRFQFDAACSLSYIVDGNCYIRKIRSGAGKPVQLWWIPHWMIEPRWLTDGTQYIGWYDYTVNGRIERIPVDDIIHWRNGIDPRNDRKGFSELKQGVRQICGLNECDTYTSAMLRNMGIVGAVISFEGDEGSVDPGEVDILRDQWREDHTSEGRGTPLVSPRGMKVQKLGMSPEEMRLDKIPARLEDTIHSLCGLSPMVTNASSGKDHKTYANYGEGRKAAYEDCLIPMQASFAECVTWNLLKADFTEGDRVRFDYGGIKCLLENETEVGERAGKAYQTYQGITRAEYREAIGLDWTDEDEIFFDQASKRSIDEEHLEDDGLGDAVELGPGSATAKAEAGADPAAPPARGYEHRRPFRDQGSAAPPRRTPGTPVGDIDEEHADNTYNLPDGQPIRRSLKKWFQKQLRETLGTLPAIGEPMPASFPALTDYNDPMASAMTPLISGYWDESGKVTRGKLGLDPADWEVHDPHLHQTIKDAAFSFCEETNATTSKELSEALSDLHKELISGLVDSGDSIRELTKRVQKVFENADHARAERIARTEASRAVHGASLVSAEESGVVDGKKILLSANACPLCVETAEKHPEGVTLHQSFATIGTNPAYSAIKMPPIHPNCRCSVAYVLSPEYEQLLAEHGPPHPDTFEPGALGPEVKPRKVAKPKQKLLPALEPQPEPELPTRNPVEPTPGEPIKDEVEEAKPKKVPKPKPDAWPKAGDTLDVVRPLGGSTGAQLVKDPKTDKLYVLKKGANADHLREEDTADKLYRAMGLDVPESKVYERPDGPVKLSRYEDGATTLGQLKHTDAAAYDAARAKLKEGFVADALLGNWDVIGMQADNVLVTAQGKVLRVDNGGSLRFRAQGGKKSALQFGNVVTELESLRNAGINPAAAEVFKGVTDDEIRSQIKNIVRKKGKILKAAPAELREVLAQRIDYLKEYGKPPKVVKVGNWKPTPAATFKTFSSTKSADDWAKKINYQKWAGELTKEELAAIDDYKGSGYSSLNRRLRTGKDLDPTQQKLAKTLDEVLQKHPLPEPVQVVRCADLQAMGLKLDQIKLGADIDDKAFISTSVNPDHTFGGGHRLEIRLPAGIPAGYVKVATNSYQHEFELLLGREVNKFRVVELKQDAHRTIVLEAVVPKKKAAKK